MFPVIALLAGIAAALALLVPRGEGVTLRAPRGDWRRLMGHGPYVRLIVFALGAYLFLQGPIALFPIFVRARGGDMEAVSHMWILMLLLEIPLVAFSGMSLERLGARGLLALGVLAGGARWTLCFWADGLGVVYVSSLLHGVVVAGLLVGAELYVEQAVPERLRATGQAALAMFGVGLGGIASNVATGWLIDRSGNDAPYLVGGLGGLLLGALLPLWLPPPARPKPAPDEQTSPTSGA
jgi:MFS family permease